MDREARIKQIIDRFGPDEQQVLLKRLDRVLTRQRAIKRFPTPGHLAQFWYPEYVQTPMLDAIDDALIMADAGMRTRWVINCPPQRGKACCGRVPVMSMPGDAGPARWTAIKDIKVGDQVFHPSGKPTRVTYVSGRQSQRQVYRVTTSDGRILDVDGEHLWTVQDRRKVKQRGSGKDRVRWMEWETITTEDIIARGLDREKSRQRASGTWTKANAFRLPRQHAIQTDNRDDLPIEPYLLGLWLADGGSQNAQIHEGVVDADELIANIESAGGATVTSRTHVIQDNGWQGVRIGFSVGEKYAHDGFLHLARQLGILRNKHIPERYLLAGTQQRLALLQGLLDGDGCIFNSGRSHRVEYSSCIPELAEQVLFLVRSLGWRPTLKTHNTSLNGERKKPRHRVTFTPVRGEYPPFRLRRKAERVQEDHSRGDELHVVTIDSIEPLGVDDVYCIQVEEPDGLFLAGRNLVATHNTKRLQAGMAWMLLRNPTLNIWFASYEQGIAGQSSLAIRQLIEQHGGGYRGSKDDPFREDSLGLQLDPDRGMQTRWSLSDVPGSPNAMPGGVAAVGVGGAFTGRPADVVVIDDPVKDKRQADSEMWQKSVTEWFESVVLTRLSKRAVIIVLQCMTGDTPVLMADGKERPLRDVRPGDEVATYEGGAVTTATVRNWANQGPDTIYSIKMRSGRTVRANARHPFLTIENGEHVWRRTGALRAGSVIQTVIGASGGGLIASKMDVASQRSARVAACPTTTSIAGPAESGPRLLMPRAVGQLTSNIDTDLLPTSMMPCSKNKVDAVPSALNIQPSGTREPTGTGSSASTMITKPDVSVDFSAMTATWQLDMESLRRSFAPPLNTYRLEPDEVIEVVPCGVEDVYDLQIDRTENFIANGLISHNTRWHEKDLSGWLLKHNEEDRWEHLNVKAQAEANDPLGRKPGEYLIDARGFDEADWERVKQEVGTRTWFALYQGDPSPPEGGTFKRKWFDDRRVYEAPEMLLTVTFVDPADNTGDGDEAGIATGGIGTDGGIYVLADDSGHYTVAQWFRKAILTMLRHDGTRLCYEKSLSGLRRSMRAEWRAMRIQARELQSAQQRLPESREWPALADQDVVAEALEVIVDVDDDAELRGDVEQQLIELWPYTQRILSMPESGPTIRGVVARGTKTFRAEMVSPLYENGAARHVGQLPQLEQQMCTWMIGQDSPDRMDAGVHLVNYLSEQRRSVGQHPGKDTEKQLPTRNARRANISRSVSGRR